MRKRNMIINAGVILLTTLIIISSQTAFAQPVLTVEPEKGGIGVSAVVKNTGNESATNVSWSIIISGNLLLLGKPASGIIPTIAPNASAQIKTGLLIGFGKIVFIANATCKEGATYQEDMNGFILLFYVIGLRESPQ